MSIKINCPVCGKVYQVQDKLAGRACKCMACGERLRVPIPQGNQPTDGGQKPRRSWIVIIFISFLLFLGGVYVIVNIGDFTSRIGWDKSEAKARSVLERELNKWVMEEPSDAGVNMSVRDPVLNMDLIRRGTLQSFEIQSMTKTGTGFDVVVILKLEAVAGPPISRKAVYNLVGHEDKWKVYVDNGKTRQPWE